MSLNSRRDERSVDVFADNIRDFNERENIWAEAFALQKREHGANVSYKAHGVDMSGKLIKGKLSNHNEDFIFTIDGVDWKIEVKTIPEWNNEYMTFKTHALHNCVTNKSLILVPKLTEYWVFGPKAIAVILEKCPARIWSGFSPNDLANRVWRDTIDELIDANLVWWDKWIGQAREFVQSHKNRLTQAKRK